METSGIIVLIIAQFIPCSIAAWFAIKGDKGDCSQREKQMTRRTAIGVVIVTTILLAIVACGVTFNWLGKQSKILLILLKRIYICQIIY